MNLIERVTHTQTTIDKFHGATFKWGEADCAQLAGQHVENFGRTTRLSECPKYVSEKGAKRALSRLGVKTMEDLADAMNFERIAPASAIVGDIVGLPGGTEEEPWTALGIHCGGERILAFANGTCEYGPVSVCSVAWRLV